MLTFMSLNSFFYAKSVMASADRIYVWNDDNGFMQNRQCRAVLADSSSFQVLVSEKKDQNFEYLVSPSNNLSVKIENLTLLRIVPEDNSEGHFSYVEVINPGEKTKELNPNISRIPRYGYIYSGSMQSISNFIFEFTEEAPKYKVAGLTLQETLWQIRFTNEQKYISLECEGYSSQQALVFDVYSKKDPSVSIATVAVEPESHLIFKKAKIHWLSRATQMYNVKQNEYNKNIDIELNVYPNTKIRYSKGSEINKELPFQVNTNSSQTSLSYGDSFKSALSINPYTGYLTDKMLRTSKSKVTTADEYFTDTNGEVVSSGEVTDIPTFDGSLSYLVCTQNATLNVRSKDNIEAVLFEAKRHEAIRPYQGFNGVESFKASLSGEEYTFVQVEFLDRDKEEEKFGWVAIDYVVPQSMCPGYQLSLGDEQPVICTENSGVNVRDESLNMNEALFVAEQFEPVAIMSNSEEKMQTINVGDETYNMIPVVFPNRDNLIGWIAKDFVQVKAQCEPYKKQGDCCVFPTHRRSKESYTNSTIMTSFDYRRAGGDRLHAGCDLYRDLGDPVVSVGPGTVIYGLKFFYLGTYELAVQHEKFIARYGEIKNKRAAGISAGQEVKSGQTLGYIARIQSLNPMLHFELYSNKNDTTTDLTNKSSRKKYKRRSDLIDPTPHLRSWERRTFGASY